MTTQYVAPNATYLINHYLPPQAAPDTAQGQFEAELNGNRIKGVVPYLASAIADFIRAQIDRGGYPWLAAPPGTVLSIKPALQSTDYIHMVRDIAMKPALSFESSQGSTPQVIARDFPPAPQQVSVFAQVQPGWQAGNPPFNYGYGNYADWLKQQLGNLPSLSGQAPPVAAGPMANGAG